MLCLRKKNMNFKIYCLYINVVLNWFEQSSLYNSRSWEREIWNVYYEPYWIVLFFFLISAASAIIPFKDLFHIFSIHLYMIYHLWQTQFIRHLGGTESSGRINVLWKKLIQYGSAHEKNTIWRYHLDFPCWKNGSPYRFIENEISNLF